MFELKSSLAKLSPHAWLVALSVTLLPVLDFSGNPVYHHLGEVVGKHFDPFLLGTDLRNYFVDCLDNSVRRFPTDSMTAVLNNYLTSPCREPGQFRL